MRLRHLEWGKLTPVGMGDGSEIERGITAFARGVNDGLIVPASTRAAVHRDLIVALAARHRLPAVYAFPYLLLLVDSHPTDPIWSPRTDVRQHTLIAS